MDVRYINPFIASIRKVFSTMVRTEVTVGKPTILPPDNPPVMDVSAVIGMSGDAVGCVVLSLPLATAVNAASQFAGITLTKDHPDFADALGELANMVAGNAKAHLEGLNVSISLPSVIVGHDHVVSQSRQQPKLLLPCQCALGAFSVEVALVVGKRPPAKTAPATAGACA